MLSVEGTNYVNWIGEITDDEKFKLYKTFKKPFVTEFIGQILKILTSRLWIKTKQVSLYLTLYFPGNIYIIKPFGHIYKAMNYFFYLEEDAVIKNLVFSPHHLIYRPMSRFNKEIYVESPSRQSLATNSVYLPSRGHKVSLSLTF